MIVPPQEVSFPFLPRVSPCQCFHYFLRKVLPWCLSSEQPSLLVGSTQPALPAAASSCQTIPPLCLQWIWEESYPEGSLMSLKKTPNKQTYVLSVTWENINIAAKCKDWVNLFLHPASQPPDNSQKCASFQKRLCNALLKEKGDLPCTAALKQGPFSFSTKSRFPWGSSESSTRRQLVPKSWHWELPTSTRCSESPACSVSLGNRPWAGAFTSPATSVVGELCEFCVNNACKKS